jgi:DNA-binding transcriptional MerR regulator
MFTIARFAERTGIPASALRFYDRKELLVPAHRLDNGYRAYASDQVAPACFINSLREADVPIAQIRAFLQQTAEARTAIVAAWQQELAARELSIKLAQHCLRAVNPDGGAPDSDGEEPPVQILRWRAPSRLCWLPVSAPPGPRPFAALVAAERRRFQRGGALVLESGYVRTRALRGDSVHGELGYRVQPRGRLPSQARVDELEPMLFATVECRSGDQSALPRALRTVTGLGFVPTGLTLERYLLETLGRSLLLIAVAPTASTPLP